LIPGEIKVAISLRLLAGGSYLDFVPLFDVKTAHIYQIFDQFLFWILDMFKFPLPDLLRNKHWNHLHQIAAKFAEKSGGLFYGTFGAIDGLAI